jgi:hypothetical protein
MPRTSSGKQCVAHLPESAMLTSWIGDLYVGRPVPVCSQLSCLAEDYDPILFDPVHREERLD